MTKEEVIAFIEEIRPKKCEMVNGRLRVGIPDHDSKIGKAIDMAIKAIEDASKVAIDALEREEIYKSTLFKIGETLVDESKLHITSEKACEQIREYLKQKDLKLSQLKEVKEE